MKNVPTKQLEAEFDSLATQIKILQTAFNAPALPGTASIELKISLAGSFRMAAWPVTDPEMIKEVINKLCTNLCAKKIAIEDELRARQTV